MNASLPLLLPLLLVSLASGVAVAQPRRPARPALTDIGLPAPIRVDRVMDEARIDGRSASVLRLHAPWPCSQAQAVLRSQWGSNWPVPLTQAQAEGWLTLSAAFRDGFLTAQWQPDPDGGCRGFLSRWPVGAPAQSSTSQAVTAPWPGAPASARWLGRTESRAGAQRHTTWLALDHRPLEQALPDWRHWLQRAGWRLRPASMPNSTDPTAGALLAGERSGSSEVGLLLRPRRQFTELVLIVQGDPT
jgi:hypothetical protein